MMDAEARRFLEDIEGLASSGPAEAADAHLSAFQQHLERGLALGQQRRFEEARAELERAYALEPRSPKVQSSLGQVYFKLGLLEAARTVYQRLLLAHPGEVPLEVNLGLVQLRLGQLEPARAALERALARAPDHVRAHAYLGLALYRLGRLEEAHEHLVRGRAHGFARRVASEIPRPAQGLEFPEATSLLTADLPVQPEVEGPSEPELSFGVDAGPPQLEAGPEGFDAGPGALGRLTLRGRAYLRAGAVLAARGAMTFEVVGARLADPEAGGASGASVSRAEGRGVALIRVPGTAVALRGVDDARVASGRLMGFEGFDWAPDRPVGFEAMLLRGRGSVLVWTAGPPLLLRVGADAPVHAARSTLVAWSDAAHPGSDSTAAPSPDSGDPRGSPLSFRGSGWVLVDSGAPIVDNGSG